MIRLAFATTPTHDAIWLRKLECRSAPMAPEFRACGGHQAHLTTDPPEGFFVDARHDLESLDAANEETCDFCREG